MKTLSKSTPRRSFIQNSIGLLGLSLLPSIDILANNYTNGLIYNTIGISASALEKISVSFKANKLDIQISTNSQGADLLFVGKLDNLSIIELGKKLRDHAIIIFEKTDNEAKLAELKALTFYKKAHLAQIESWNEKTQSKLLFDKVTFIETSVDEALVHQSISYLNILSKLTDNGGFLIA